jgi:hypothetical protein
MNVTVIHEVWTDTVGAQLGLQWCQYAYPTLPQYGYRFIWRDEQGQMYPELGSALIPRAAWMLELIQKATEAGWFVTVELGAGAHQLRRAK